jgi:hypothetical protein
MKLMMLVMLILLNGCIGETLFSIGPIKIKPGDIISAPSKINKVITKEKDNE